MRVYVDGMCLNNHLKDSSKRKVFICVNLGENFIVSNMDQPLKYLSNKLGYDIKPSNQVAEYLAILSVLRNLKDELDVTICSDSEVVVSQINGDYKVKDKGLFLLYCEVHKLIYERNLLGRRTKIVHVKGEDNPANLHLKKLKNSLRSVI